MAEEAIVTSPVIKQDAAIKRVLTIVLLLIAVIIVAVFLVVQMQSQSEQSDVAVQTSPTPTPVVTEVEPADDKRDVSVYLLEGTPRLIREDIDVSVYNGMVLIEGDTIQANDADLVVTIDDLYFISMSGGSELTLDMLTKEMTPIVSLSSDAWMRSPIEGNDLTVTTPDFSIQLEGQEIAALFEQTLFAFNGEVSVLAGDSEVEVSEGEAYDVDTASAQAVESPNTSWTSAQLCLDPYFIGFTYNPADDSADIAEEVYESADDCVGVLGLDTVEDQDTVQASSNTGSTNQPTSNPQPTSQPTVTPSPTLSPTPMPATLTLAIADISDANQVSCSWEYTSVLAANQSVSYSLWESIEGANDVIVMDWETAATGDTGVDLGSADSLGLDNQHSYYCKVQLMTAGATTSMMSERFFYDLSSGLLNIAEPAGSFNGEIEGDGQFYDMDIDDVRVRFYIRQNQPGTSNYGKYCVGSNSWGTTQSWIEAPLVVSINQLFLFNKDAFHCHDAGADEQATFLIQMLNRRTGAILYEHSFPVVLD